MKNYRAIIYDDNEVICQLLDILLSEHGYKCDYFTDFNDAIAALEKKSYEIAFIDWEIYEELAIEAFSLIKLLPFDRRPKAFAVMSYLSAGEIIFAKENGALDCLAKPFNEKTIKDLLDKFVNSDNQKLDIA